MDDRIELIKDKLAEGRWFTSFFWSTFSLYLTVNGFLIKLVFDSSGDGASKIFLTVLMILLSLLIFGVFNKVSAYREALRADIEKLSEGTKLPSLESNFLPLYDSIGMLKAALALFVVAWFVVLAITLMKWPA